MWTAEIPVPRVATFSSARIAQRLELQPCLGQAGFGTICQQSGAISRHEVRHRAPFPDVAMQPEATLHGMDHPVAARGKLAIRSATGGAILVA